ncbi:MAG TPA: hypothetical protein VFQ45_04640 [Longimicrobium sp.]|nr:hypothetical protein [Longimicrobium sp.]
MTRALRHTLPLLTLTLAAACASASRTRTAYPAPCESGTAVLMVRNDSGRDVEIVESRIGSGALTVVAVIPTGRHEVKVRNESGYSYSARAVGGGPIVASTNLRRTTNRFVTFERECRSERV